MATLTPQQLAETSAFWVNKWFVLPNVTANLTTADLTAAISAIDSAFDTTLNAAVTAGHGPQTVAQALNWLSPHLHQA